MNVFHGSVNIVKKPVFGEGKPYNDYGRGFYCTEHAELAKEWACYGTLSLSDLSEAMRLGKLGEQVVLKSKRAFEALTFVEAIEAPHEEYFAKYKARDEEARDKYKKIASKPLAEDETYVIDIIRNNLKNGQSI